MRPAPVANVGRNPPLSGDSRPEMGKQRATRHQRWSRLTVEAPGGRLTKGGLGLHAAVGNAGEVVHLTIEGREIVDRELIE